MEDMWANAYEITRQTPRKDNEQFGTSNKSENETLEFIGLTAFPNTNINLSKIYNIPENHSDC